MFGFGSKRKKNGVLRCRICGEERDRVPRGLFYGFPRCASCGGELHVVTSDQLETERRTADQLEREAGIEGGLFHVG